MKKCKNKSKTIRKSAQIVIIIVLLSLLFMPSVQAEHETNGFISFRPPEIEYDMPDIPYVTFKRPLTFEIEYKPGLTIPNGKMLPNETKDIGISLEDKKASLKLEIPALSISDLGLELPSQHIEIDCSILGKLEIPLVKYDILIADASAKLVINSSVVGNVAIENHTSDQRKVITQLAWQKSQKKEAEINSTGYSIGDSVDVYLVNPKYRLSFEIVIFGEIFRGAIGFEKKIVQQKLIEITGQSYAAMGNIQIVSWTDYHTRDMLIGGIFVIAAAVVIFVRIKASR